jgi:NitT/TauT family transport system permease protein
MRWVGLPQRRFASLADALVLLLLATGIYALVLVGAEWRAEYHPVTQIRLSIWALPTYVLFSASRGMAAYLCSLAFTLVVGYAAGKSRTAEKFIIPALDILQSVPVLGFLPGLTLGLVALFPRTNTGLELAAIIMIFTGQVWNMTFSYYSSLKSIPSDLREAATVIGLGWRERLLRLELPFSAMGLAWNSLMSMAGGWFFLVICEAFRLGEQEYRLPGVGAYMAVAIAQGNLRAMVFGVIAMTLLILVMDLLIWRPILAWVHRYRLTEMEGEAGVHGDPLMQMVARESRLLRWMRVELRHYLFHHRHSARVATSGAGEGTPAPPVTVPSVISRPRLVLRRFSGRDWSGAVRVLEILLIALVAAGSLYGGWKLVAILGGVAWGTWVVLLRNTLWTLLRVLACLVLSTLWAVPVGIWLGVSPRRTRIAQPIIQVLASFPAPMLYPLATGAFLWLGIGISWGSMFLMLLGVQWYVLFNVLAGALRIPRELGYALDLMESSRWVRWTTLYVPSVFPALVTGWVTAAGGAWNASVVAEYVSYRGGILRAGGIGATIFEAAERADFPLLAASLTIMVGVVVVLNRTFWARLYQSAQTRFRMDL